MFDKLELADYPLVAALFDGMDYHLCLQTVLEGSSPGAVFADSTTRPASAFVSSPEGSYLAGEPHTLGFNQGLHTWLDTTVFQHDQVEFVITTTSGWEATLPQIIPQRQLMVDARRSYACRAVVFDWRAQLLPDYQVVAIDAGLLAGPLSIPAHILGWIANNWGDQAAFFAHGFGFVLLVGQTVAGWCLADCASPRLGRAEVGIHTAPGYRQRGVAAITAAATVEHALSQGFEQVGWHCSDSNIGSWKTAEKVGFVQVAAYHQYYC